jgi:methylmalonyl-CoA mutase
MAGYEITTVLNDDSVMDGVKKALDEKPGIIVLCSSDDEYPTLGVEYLNALRNANIPVVMAGSPGDNEAMYREAGVHSFVHMRTAALEALENYQTVLSVQ